MCTDKIATSFEPAITNVSPEPRELSKLGMRVLFERLEGDQRQARLELLAPHEITRRDSVVSFA